jgi:hypothetical protein
MRITRRLLAFASLVSSCFIACAPPSDEKEIESDVEECVTIVAWNGTLEASSPQFTFEVCGNDWCRTRTERADQARECRAIKGEWHEGISTRACAVAQDETTEAAFIVDLTGYSRRLAEREEVTMLITSAEGKLLFTDIRTPPACEVSTYEFRGGDGAETERDAGVLPVKH